MITSYSRGHKIQWSKKLGWVYSDDPDKPVYENERACKKCEQFPTEEGYDACQGFVEGAFSVCCGHGVYEGYVKKPERNKKV